MNTFHRFQNELFDNSLNLYVLNIEVSCKCQHVINEWCILKVGDCSSRTIGLISLLLPRVLPTAEKRRYEILRKTRLERFAGIGDRAGLPNKIRMLYKVPTPAPNLLILVSDF